MTDAEIARRVTEFQERCCAIKPFAMVNMIYWPNAWVCTAGEPRLRGQGATAREALDAFEARLVEVENADKNLAQTLGVAAE